MVCPLYIQGYAILKNCSHIFEKEREYISNSGADGAPSS
jgi:hypothetical protein